MSQRGDLLQVASEDGKHSLQAGEYRVRKGSGAGPVLQGLATLCDWHEAEEAQLRIRSLLVAATELRNDPGSNLTPAAAKLQASGEEGQMPCCFCSTESRKATLPDGILEPEQSQCDGSLTGNSEQ